MSQLISFYYFIIFPCFWCGGGMTRSPPLNPSSFNLEIYIAYVWNTWNSYSWIRIQELKPFSLYHWTHKSQNFVISSKYGPAVILFVDIKTFEPQCSCCWPLPAIIIPHITVTRLMQHFIACECKRHVQQTCEQCVTTVGMQRLQSTQYRGRDPSTSYRKLYYLFHTQSIRIRILRNQVLK